MRVAAPTDCRAMNLVSRPLLPVLSSLTLPSTYWATPSPPLDAPDKTMDAKDLLGLTHLIARHFQKSHARFEFSASTTHTKDSGIVVVFVGKPTPYPTVTATKLIQQFRLTPREAEVALLLADRCSNKEIANKLGVTAYTAERHTERVLAKLGVNSRRLVKTKIGCDPRS